MRPSYEMIYTGKFMLQLLFIDLKDRPQDKLVFQDNDCTIEEQIGDIVSDLGRILREKKNVYVEYSCAVKPHVRSGGNRQSDTWEPPIRVLLA